MKTSPSQNRVNRTWSLELVLVIALPLIAVLACAVTLFLALRYPAHESVNVDRFGHVVEAPR
ncbi:MAG: hypothetical protein JWQ90_3806 [Hydrocarboniphaga sp.]|uniref:hypothetical protein n=1 Tax=Hydrocarboniphaga sp. TaxID=2033016 RepID=UPI002618EC0C|nr:hypothetical protein [Hydrocarboniphaga sp.]MDB5971356.1 hypothetical protein [Hydrocarboniphaga sp.]